MVFFFNIIIMQLGIYPKLTKKYILDRINQEQIMEKYLGVPVVFNKLIIAPNIIRNNDNNPTCAFYYNENGKLRFRDLSGAFWGDCFDVVAKAINVDSKGAKEFQLILHTIAKDFRIHKYQDIKEVNNYNNITSTFFKKKKTKLKTIIKIIPRTWNYHDLGYWKKFNISQDLLNIGKVYPAEEIWISKNHLDYTKVYRYSTKDPAYCYFGGKDVNSIDNWKIYYPYRKKYGDKPRFHSNSSFLQGKHLFTPSRIGIITKSYKDVLSFRSFGLQAVAPSAESVLLEKEDYLFIKRNVDFIISCMDYDYAGIKMANQLYKAYKITPIMFTNGRFNTKNYFAKDFAEYVDNNGKEKTLQLLKQLYNNHLDEFHKLDLYYYNSLKFTKL